MAVEVLAGQVVGRRDPAVGVDQVADAAGHAPVVVVLARLALGVVEAADGLVGVADQRVAELFGVGEGLLLLDSVERRADYYGAGCLELRGSVTEPPALARSTGGRGLGVPPQGYPAAPQVGQTNGVAVLVGRLEVGGLRVHIEHGLRSYRRPSATAIRPLGAGGAGRVRGPAGAAHATGKDLRPLLAHRVTGR